WRRTDAWITTIASTTRERAGTLTKRLAHSCSLGPLHRESHNPRQAPSHRVSRPPHADPEHRGRHQAGTTHPRTDRLPRSSPAARDAMRSEEHTSELQSRENLVCRLLLE